MQIELTPEYLKSQGISVTAITRFWQRVQKTESCWNWIDLRNHYGYGIMDFGKYRSVHRLSWFIHRGRLKDGEIVKHLCGHIVCVNPEHLYLSTKEGVLHNNPVLAKYGLLTTFDFNFWNKVTKTDGCWPWTGYTNACGYGVLAASNGKTMLAHRASFLLHKGDFFDQQVLHRCDNPPCVNPDHLWLGNHVKNMQDRQSKNRTPKGEDSGSAKLTEEIVLAMRDDYANGMTRMAISKKHNTSYSNAFAILHRLSWAHI